MKCMQNDVRLFMVIPCYNEQEVLPETSKRLEEKFKDLVNKGIISSESRAVFVDDGSADNTWEMIEWLEKNGQDYSNWTKYLKKMDFLLEEKHLIFLPHGLYY